MPKTVLVTARVLVLAPVLALVLALLCATPASFAKPKNPCQKQDSCRSYGRCTWRGGECVVGGDEDCRKSLNCKGSGQCSRSDLGYCTARTDADCAGSRTCKESGMCQAKAGTCQRKVIKITDANRHTAVAVTYHMICARDARWCLPSPVNVGRHFAASCGGLALARALDRARPGSRPALSSTLTATETGEGVACYKPGSKNTRRWGFVVKKRRIRPHLRRAGKLRQCKGYISALCSLCGKTSAACKGAPGSKTSPGKCTYEAALLAKATAGRRAKELPAKLIAAVCGLY